jgi:hypothetical protein
VFRLVLGQALRLVAIGVGVGLLVAAGSTRALETMLYQTDPFDPVTWSSRRWCWSSWARSHPTCPHEGVPACHARWGSRRDRHQRTDCVHDALFARVGIRKRQAKT